MVATPKVLAVVQARLGRQLGIALAHALQLVFVDGHLVGAVAQQQQAADHRAEGQGQKQPGEPGHGILHK